MSRLRQLVAIEGVAVIALIAVAGALALAGFVDSIEHRPGAVASMWFLGTAMIGAPFVLFVGAPAYWALARKRRATWLSALVVGVTPGAALIWLNPALGLLSLGCGAAVATLTHWWCGKFELTRGPARRPDGR